VKTNINFEEWSHDCPMRDGSKCITVKRACKRIRCPRIDIFKSWRHNEKQKQKPKKWW